MYDALVAGGLAAGAGAVAAGASVCAYGGLSDESQLFGRSLVAPPEMKQLALTFDDGPNPQATPQLLEVLARHEVRATFFLIGTYALREPALVGELLSAGHSIGNHTMHHLWLPRHSEAVLRDEIVRCNQELEERFGVRINLFRAPHGARSPSVFRIASEAELRVCQWNLMVGDWKSRSSADLYRRLDRGIEANQRRKRGTCVVLHDGSQREPAADRSSTIAAVDLLLSRSGDSLKFVTLPEWV